MSKKIKVPSILLTNDFYTKPRNRKWMYDEGAEAVVILQCVWLASSQERDCKILKDEVMAIAFPIQINEERVFEILESAVRVGLLESDSTHYWNSQIVQDSDNFKKKQLRYKEAAQERERSKIVAKSSHDSATNLAEPEQNPGRIIVNTEREGESEYESEEKKKIVPGKTKISEYVHLSDLERDDVLLEFKRFGLDWKHVERACIHLDRWLAEPGNAHKRRHAIHHLKTWGLKEVMKDQQAKNDLQASENRKKGIRPGADPPRVPEWKPPPEPPPLTAEGAAEVEKARQAIRDMAVRPLPEKKK